MIRPGFRAYEVADDGACVELHPFEISYMYRNPVTRLGTIIPMGTVEAATEADALLKWADHFGVPDDVAAVVAEPDPGVRI